MRRIFLFLFVIMAASCTSKDATKDKAATESATSSSTTIAVADIRGEWRVQAMTDRSDSVITMYKLWVGDDTTLKIKFDNRPDTIFPHIIAVAGDSIVTQTGPYRSIARDNAMVTTISVLRLQNGKLVGRSVAHYAVTTPDSVMAIRSEGTRRAEGATGVKACELLSVDDVTRITGVAFEAGVTTNDYAGDSQCRYGRPGKPEEGLMVTLHAHGDLAPYRGVPNSVAVDGLGDAAVWHDGNRQLAFSNGDAVISISFLAPPAKKQWAVQLARIALNKLKAASM